jgi:sugar/nucleoside kinase (ribokinase family)
MDPQHGMLTPNVIENLITIAKKYNVPLFVDTQISHKSSNHHLYGGAHTMFLNESEARAVYKQFNPLDAEKSLKAIRKKLNITNVIVKLGEHGSIALVGNRHFKTPAAKVDAVDPCGAGDAFLSAYCLGDHNCPEDALRIANAWAALSTTIPGTIPPQKQALIELWAAL